MYGSRIIFYRDGNPDDVIASRSWPMSPGIGHTVNFADVDGKFRIDACHWGDDASPSQAMSGEMEYVGAVCMCSCSEIAEDEAPEVEAPDAMPPEMD